MRMLGKPWEPQVNEWARAHHPLMPIGCPSGPLSFNRRQGWVASVRGGARRRMWRPWVGSDTSKPVIVSSSRGIPFLVITHALWTPACSRTYMVTTLPGPLG